jgi:oligopeptide transport system substrate-binding protein
MKSKLHLLLIFIICFSIALSLLGSGCISQRETLTLFGSSPLTLDPAMARESTSLEYIVEIFSGLVCFDPDLKLTPDIAESWDISGNGTIYTFHLRQGVEFHSGRKVTANDFKYSLERVCDPATGSQTAETYLGDIVGVKEKLQGKANEINGIKVIDDYTLQITIDAPKEYFLPKLSYPTAFVVDKANVESGENWWKKPNGTGPFKLREWKEGKQITLERNELYYLEPAKVRQVVYLLGGGVPMIMYEDNKIDVTDVSLGDIERVLDPSNPLHEELSIVPGFSLYYIGFNSAKPPFDDAKIRQAFSYAIDKDKIIDLVLKGVVSKAEGILPPGMPGYNKDIQGLDFNVERAKQLIAESKYGNVSNLPTITLTTAGMGAVSSIEAALVDMWQHNLGVKVEIRQLSPDRYPYEIMDEKDEMFVQSWGADYPDPQNFLDILFHSGTKDNVGEYSNPEVDTLLEKAGVEQDTATRMNLYQQAEQMMVNDAACLPIYFDVSYTLVKPYVKDLPLTPLWIPKLRYVSIEPH